MACVCSRLRKIPKDEQLLGRTGNVRAHGSRPDWETSLVLVRKTPYRREILLGNVATRSAAADEVKPLPQS